LSRFPVEAGCPMATRGRLGRWLARPKDALRELWGLMRISGRSMLRPYNGAHMQ
jgi:hypothetical protein